MIRKSFYFFPLISVALAFFWITTTAQVRSSKRAMEISLKDILEMGKTRSPSFKLADIRLSAVMQDLKDAGTAALPTILASAAYQRYSKLTLFEEGLGGRRVVPRLPGPNGASAGIDLAFNLYSGGKTKATVEEQSYRKDAQLITRDEKAGNGAFEACRLYMLLIEQYNLKKLIADQLARANNRLKNVNALYKNERVTRSDVLRTELMLSDVQLLARENQNNISILNNKLVVLLDLENDVTVSPLDSADMAHPTADQIRALIKNGVQESYGIRLAGADISINSAKEKIVASNNLPSISIVSAYNYAYPNYLFFPPVDQLYGIGYVGIRFSYNISSLYNNRHKQHAANLRISEAQQQKQILSDQITEQVTAMEIRYEEALNRIKVLDNSIQQAKVNLRIINTKYKNQLALLTDLLDADNLLQEASFKLTSAQTETIILYYNILFSIGKI